jgi:hypothetical protein
LAWANSHVYGSPSGELQHSYTRMDLDVKHGCSEEALQSSQLGSTHSSPSELNHGICLGLEKSSALGTARNMSSTRPTHFGEVERRVARHGQVVDHDVSAVGHGILDRLGRVRRQRALRVGRCLCPE